MGKYEENVLITCGSCESTWCKGRVTAVCQEKTSEHSKLMAQCVNKIKADTIDECIEILRGIAKEVPYENSAFGYGVNICEFSKAVAALKKKKERINNEVHN